MKLSNFLRFTFFLLSLAALWTSIACAQAPAPPPAPLPAPRNLDFEQGQPGRGAAGVANLLRAVRGDRLHGEDRHRQAGVGRQAVRVSLQGGAKNPNTFGNLLTFFDATPYRGKRDPLPGRGPRRGVRPGIRPRSGCGWTARAAPWASSTTWRTGRSRSSEWKTLRDHRRRGARRQGDVPGDDAARPGEGLDRLRLLRADRRGGAATSPPGRSTPAGWRTWPPSPGCSATSATSTPATRPPPRTGRSWRSPASRAAEKAGSPAELAKALEDFFRPWRPRCGSSPPGARGPALPAELKAAAGAETVFWAHLGVKLSAAAQHLQERADRAACRLPRGPGPQFSRRRPTAGKRVILRAGRCGTEDGPGF